MEQNTNGLPYYSTIDVSGTTDPLVTDNRRISSIGTCIHTTSGTDSLDWLAGGSAKAGNPASADYLIRRDGIRYKITPPGRYAYHAGRSILAYNNAVYRDDEVSQLLIGVELENQDFTYVTWQQVDSLAELVVSDPLACGWRWPYYLIGHYEVARPIGRRSDPQGLDWGSLMGRLYIRAKTAGIGGM